MAAAQSCGGSNVPPGNSEVDQYSETVPNGCGNSPAGGGGDGNPDAVPPDTAAALEELGGDGAAALALARANSPERSDGAAKAIPFEGGDDDDSLGDVVTGIVDAAGGSSGAGLGLILPLILVAVSVAAGFYLARNRNAG
jgi:hypothetical protein